MSRAAPRTRVRVRHVVQAADTAVAARGRVGAAARRPARPVERRRQDRLVESRAAIDSTFARALGRAAESGRNPTDRGRPGVKQHLLMDGTSVDTTPANVPEVTMTLPLVDAVGPVGGRRRWPRRRPRALYADRAFDSERHRRAERRRGIVSHFARRRVPHGSGLGVFRWVVERTIE